MATSAHNSAVVAAALSLALIDASAISGGDVLARVSSLVASSSAKSASSLLSIQTSDVPVEITKALESKSLQWEALSDEVRIGLLWSYGYVLRGGSTTRLVPVYTACSAETTAVVGINENRLGVTMDSIELTSAAFNSTSCGASACTDYLEATTTNCSPSISSPLQCAISAADVPESSAAFWTSASRVATTPYPQVYAHSVPVTSGSPVHIVSIHMATAAAAVGCASTADAVIPCLALDSATQSRKFCRPNVNDVQLNAFLDSISTNQDQAIEVSTRADGTGSSSSGLSTGAIIGIVGGALVVLGLVAFYFFRSSRKPPAPKDSPDERVYTGLGPKNPHGGPSNNPYGMPLQRNNTTMGPVMDNRDNDTVNSTDMYNDSMNDSARRNPLLESDRSIRARRSSVSAADKGPYGKSTADYMDESEVLREFFNDNNILFRRIPHDELTTLRILSKGSYGEVFLGQLETRHVAMKRLLPEKKHLTRSIEQFTAEIRLMTQLEHRNIVSFIGVCWDYVPNITVVVEYMDNGDLAEVLAKSKGKLTWPKEKISISMDIAEGLVYLHSMRPVIVHRDLKSKNVLLNKRGQAKLSDFGVSRKTAVNETMTSGVGTLLWTAPEIIEGRKYSEKADIFSLGVVLSEIDTGEEPYASVRGDTSGERLPGMQLVQMVRLGEIKVAFRDDCPRKIRELAEKCTSLDPDRRPTSMEVAYTLKSIIAPTLRR